MGSHPSHNMHSNSKAAWRMFDMPDRSRDVCEVFHKFGALSDREVCDKLGSKDMNCARPSITHLRDSGVLIELREKYKCPVTNRKVRRCVIAKNPVYNPPHKDNTLKQLESAEDLIRRMALSMGASNRFLLTRPSDCLGFNEVNGRSYRNEMIACSSKMILEANEMLGGY